MRFGLLFLLFLPLVLLVVLHGLLDADVSESAYVARCESVADVQPAMLVGRAVERPQPVAPEGLLVSVSGRVVGPDGLPIPYAHVCGREDGDEPPVTRAVADAEGRFTLPGAPFDGCLDVVAAGVGRARTWVDGEDLRDVRVRVHPGRPLHGRVLDPDGILPVEGAVVVAEEDDFGALEARTRADGSFTIPMVPVDLPFDLRVDAGAAGWKRMEEVRFAEGVELGIVLDALHALEGRLVARDESGAWVGVPDVLVEADEECGREGVCVRTDEEGRFRFQVCGWEGRVRILSSAWWAATRSTDYDGTCPLRIEVEPTSRVAGVCLGIDGVPAAGARVRVGERWSWREGRTDAAGRFVVAGVHLTGKGLEVRASKDDDRGRGRVFRGGEGAVVVRLEPGAFVRGRVLDAHGRACPGAWVVVGWVPDPENAPKQDEREYEQADASGAFRVAGIPEGPCRVEVEYAGHEKERLAGVQARRGGTDLGVIHLRRLATLEGVLVDEQGAPIPGGRFRTTWGPTCFRPVDPDGSFTAGVSAEDDTRIELSAHGYLRRTIDLDAPPADQPLTVVLARAPAVEGRVLDEDGLPLVGVLVTADGIGIDESGRTRTDVAGGVRIEVPCAGRYALHVEAVGHVFPDDLEADTGSRGVEIRALALPWVAGRVADVDGEAWIGAWVRVENEADGRSWEDRTDHRGRFRITGLEGASFCVSVRYLPQGECVRSLAHVRPDTAGLVLRAEYGQGIGGRVVDASGSAAPRVSVRAYPVGHVAEEHCCTTGEDGVFTLLDLLPGLYRLEAERRVGEDRFEVCAPVWTRTDADDDVLLVLEAEPVRR